MLFSGIIHVYIARVKHIIVRVKHREKGCITPLHSHNQTFTGQLNGAAAPAPDSRTPSHKSRTIFSYSPSCENKSGTCWRLVPDLCGSGCSWACFPFHPYPCTVIRECHEPPVPDNHEDRSPVCLCRGVILRACPLQTEAEAVPVLYPCRHPRFLLRCADKLHTRSSRFLFCLHYVLAHCVHYSVIRKQKKEGVSASSSSCVSCSYMFLKVQQSIQASLNFAHLA